MKKNNNQAVWITKWLVGFDVVVTLQLLDEKSSLYFYDIKTSLNKNLTGFPLIYFVLIISFDFMKMATFQYKIIYKCSM